MKLLFWLEPFLDLNAPGTMTAWLRWFERMDASMSANKNNDYQARLVAFDSARDDLGRFAGRSVIISQRDMRLGWKLPGEFFFKLDRELNEFGEFWGAMLRERLGDFAPDVVILLSESRWLRKIFPEALFVNVEVGWCYRNPYPNLWGIDPSGWGKGRFLSEYWDDILPNIRYGAEEQNFIRLFKEASLRRTWSQTAYDFMANQRRTARPLRLLPLAERFALDGATPIFAAIQYLLENDASVDYLITQHPLAKALTEREQAYLCVKYMNVIFPPEGPQFGTQFLLPWADEVVADFSSVAIQALLFDVTQVSVVERLPFADSLCFLRNPLARKMSHLSPENKNKVLFWLLTHYGIDQSKVLDGSWFGERIRMLLSGHQAGRMGNLFDDPSTPLSEWYESGWLHSLPRMPESILNRKLSAVNSVRAVAFYLPQFHRIDENDTWWGKGFTEWANVRQGSPNFEGHYQPHVPADMGYYDLSDISVLARQAELAREYGLEGFCFYYYWFDGKRLLEKPVDVLLKHPEINLPFCLCWANENWTRRWDGSDQEVLIAQSYNPALHEQFARDLVPYFSDPRYIRVGGKPVLLIYRSDIIPDLPATLAAWRQVWHDAGIGGVYLVGVESFRVFKPDETGFDANCEFLPHQADPFEVAPDVPLKRPQLPVQFLGDYDKLANYWMGRPRAEYKRFRSLMPSWDNSARRRKGGAGLFVNATPERYRDWLEQTLERTCEEFEGDERLVFINAWNEWGEGCHLEPDARFGRRYLEATRSAIDSLGAKPPIEAKPQNLFLQNYRDWRSARLLAPGEQAQLPERVADWPFVPRMVVVVDPSGRTTEELNATLASLEGQAYAPSGIWVCAAEQPRVVSTVSLRWLPDARDWKALDRYLAQSEDVDWVLLLRAGDELDRQALLLLGEGVVSNAGMTCCYFDEDRLEHGECSDPFFKPDFNLDLLRSYAYCGRVLAFERRAMLEVGGFVGDAGELSPHDLMWRLLESKGFGSIGHIAEVLVHCRYGLGQWLAQDDIRELSARAVSAHLARLGIAHSVVAGAASALNRVLYTQAGQPSVSIIVQAQDRLPMLQRCVESVLEKTQYPNYEVLLMDDPRYSAETKGWLAGLDAMNSSRLRVLRFEEGATPAGFVNQAAARARGDYLLMLACDVAAIEPGWLTAMLNHAVRPEVAVVGARLIGPDERILHSGMVLGLHGTVGEPFEGASAKAPGYMHRLVVDQNYSAVSGDCLLIRKSVFDEVGGLDTSEAADAFADADLCLKTRLNGYLTVWTPYAQLLQGSASEPVKRTEQDEVSTSLFYERWLGIAAVDPAYNPSLSLQTPFALESVAERLPWQPFSSRQVPSFLCYAADQYGSGQYRVIQPFQALEHGGFAQGFVSDYLLDPVHVERMKPDAVVLQRQHRNIQQLELLKAFSSAFRVFELDDYILELPKHSVHRANFGKDIEQQLGLALSRCDRLVVSTEALAESLRHLHSDIRVCPNRLPPGLWNIGVQDRDRPDRRPRVGWAGGAGHTGDLMMVSDVIKTLSNEVDWVFLGMCPAELMPYVAEFHPGVGFDRYPQLLASLDLDLAIAPLEANRFNVCKSNLRLLEYGMCGFPVICSDIEPYRGGLSVTRVGARTEQWVDAIRMHLSDPAACREQGLQLRSEVLANWMLTDEAALDWGQVWLPG